MPVDYNPVAKRSWLKGISRGFSRKCPQCGEGRIFARYMTNHEQCSVCDLYFSGHRADYPPPYFTIMIVGHVIIPLALAVKQIFEPSLGMQFLIWIPVLTVSTYYFLPRSKGALIGLQWANYMHGFAKTS